jgi:3'-phosphoadenosine 5'-phosphosulfate sulfotransferase (PAPS reductase)/FAD synthetase
MNQPATKKTFIAFSLGVESTTMCLLYGKGATAIFTDTGSEHQELYDRLALVQSVLKAHHGGDFEIKVIKPTQTVAGVVCHSLQEVIEAKKFMPSGQARYCTVEWKIKPMDAFLKSQGPCELLIGFNADEEPGKDRTGNLMRCANVTYSYPLYEDGHTRDDCKALLRQHGLEPNYPIYMARGGCWFCPFKRVAEYKAMYYFDRPTFEKGRGMETGIQDKREVFFAISMSGRSFDDIAAECEREKELWGEAEVKRLYKQIENGPSCGAFCHR